MNYHISNTINYENEAVQLILMHYGEDKGYRNWMQSALEKRKFREGFLETMMMPLIALEEEVFEKVTISEADLHLYFDTSKKALGLSSLASSIAVIFGEMEHYHLGKDENEKKLIYASLVLADIDLQFDKAAQAPDTEEFIRLLRHSSMETGYKWDCCDIYCNLMEHIAYFKSLITPVIEILKQHETELLQVINDHLPEGAPEYLKDKQFICSLNLDELKMDYSIFGFNSVILNAPDIAPEVGYAHYGIYVDELVHEKARMEADGLQAADRWKSLSDKSRIKILCLLKQREMFGQELKEAMGLSNATISHHMNALLVDDFVTLRKEGSKVIYSLNREKIAEAIDEIRHVLLD